MLVYGVLYEMFVYSKIYVVIKNMYIIKLGLWWSLFFFDRIY